MMRNYIAEIYPSTGKDMISDPVEYLYYRSYCGTAWKRVTGYTGAVPSAHSGVKYNFGAPDLEGIMKMFMGAVDQDIKQKEALQRFKRDWRRV